MATVFVPKETLDGEARVAVTPETTAKLIKAGAKVTLEKGAGAASYFPDALYVEAGATIVPDAASGFGAADLVLKVREPSDAEVEAFREGSTVVAMFYPHTSLDQVKRLNERKVNLFAMNLVPRISRAQSMDVLSSQANIGGYKAVLLAAVELPRYFPLLMTAAGTVKPAKVVVMGAGVAGLQAIATARRLGAQVWATDVRIAVKEQVESLGAKFIDVPGMEDLEDERGYAREATPEFLERQRKVVGDKIADSNVVITTAQIPGRKAPVLVPASLVQRMNPGSVIVDLAAEQGGNCEGTVAGQRVVSHGVIIVGPSNIPASMPYHASELFARNVANFVTPMLKEGELVVDWEDQVQADSAVVHGGVVKHGPTAEMLSGEGASAS